MCAQISTPPMKPSEESTEEQLRLARQQGESYALALAAMDRESGADVQRAGEYEVAVVVEHAEGMYHLAGEELVWKNPASENAHVEVAVRDAADGRFVPALDVTVTVIDGDGTEVGTHTQPFLWHPWLYHYGRNWELAGDGNYKLRVRIEAPAFMRHDHENGRRFAGPVEVEFDRYIRTGQKTA
jgi:uncharacterized protein involved in high-affinity Fe2+ transport